LRNRNGEESQKLCESKSRQNAREHPGVEEMNCLSNNRSAKYGVTQYATSQDCHHVFVEDMAYLYRLSFFLTLDRDQAEQCFVAGLDECVKGNTVFREWARSWAKRNIIQQAIRTLQPHPEPAVSSVHATLVPESKPTTVRAEHFEVNRVMALQQFERFVFVMSVLEQYSEHDCAQLLGCSVQDILRARMRALRQLGRSDRASSDHKSGTQLQETSR
jgi:DNA-directed RNA polymerase specialized sigma24 family protein